MKDDIIDKERRISGKFPRYFPYLATFCVLIWFGLFIDRVFLFQDPHKISKITAQLEFVVHFLIIFYVFRIYGNKDRQNQGMLFWFLITNIGLFLSDVSWYFIAYSGNANVLDVAIVPFLLDLIPFSFWIIASIVFLFQILKNYVLQIKYRIKTISIFVLINIAVIFLFLSSIHYAKEGISLSTASQASTFIAQIVVFDFVILCLIYAESIGLTLFLSGVIILIAGNFFLVYSIVSQTAILSTYGELLWFMGLLFNLFGILIIEYKGDYDIKHWVRKDNSIKSKLIFWCFSTAIIGFLLFFIIAYAFSLINKAVFLGLPVFIMIYSSIIITASLYIGEYFEEPFKRIEGNIKNLMLRDKATTMNENFSIEEFIFLQKFIVEAFKYQEETEQAKLGELIAQREAEHLRLENDAAQAVVGEQEKFRTIVKQTLHDIQSPLSSLGTIVEEHNINMPEDTRVTLRNAADRIGDIANNLLNQYTNKNTGENESTPLLVSLALLQIMSEKRYEYSDSYVKFITEFAKMANFAFIKINSADFKRMVSNLVNNAVEALKDKDDGRVSIELSATNENVVVSIEDNGHGMQGHIKEKFFQGIAITEGKDGGHGIGLTQIRDTINANNGKCNIYVTEGERTRFVIKFPIIATPQWIASEIQLYLDDTVVVLDDDESIHGAWDAKFHDTLKEFPTLKIKHFTHGADVIDYINGLSDIEKCSILLLTDYELLNQGMNGLDVVKETKMARTLLVTSYSANPQIQDLILAAGIKLLPKEFTSIVAISVDKKIKKWSRKVDMVWVEDQKWFVDDLVRNYYSHIKVDIYYDPDSFMAEVHQYPLDTRIILDTYYFAPDGTAYRLDGFAVAEKLHELGYTNLILFSGEVVEQDNIPEYLKVIFKNDQVNKKQLDKI